MSTKEEVLGSLHGQTYRIRGLTSALPEEWPHAVHPDYEEAKPVVDDLIEKIGGSDAKKEWLRLGDFANFAGAWWPYAGADELKTLAQLTIWVIRWHDEIDDAEGRFLTDPDGAKEYIGDTVAFVRQALHIDEADDDELPESPHATIEAFREIGDNLSKASNEDQRKVIFDEIEQFVTSMGGIQDLLLSGRLPSLEEYWTLRNSSSAIGVGIALIEYAGKFSLPADLRNHDAMRKLYEKTEFIVALINDVAALKVRVARGNHVHIVPLLCAHDAELGNSVQAAVDAALAQVQPAVDEFEAAAAELLAAAASVDDGDDDGGDAALNAETFVKGCRHIITGNVDWSLKCHRFGLDVVAADEDGVEFELVASSV